MDHRIVSGCVRSGYRHLARAVTLGEQTENTIAKTPLMQLIFAESQHASTDSIKPCTGVGLAASKQFEDDLGLRW